MGQKSDIITMVHEDSDHRQELTREEYDGLHENFKAKYKIVSEKPAPEKPKELNNK